MRRSFLPGFFLVLLLTARFAGAVCPPDCVGGGGPSTTDCVITWGGITSTASSCVDGTSCDADGVADGICTFPLQACFGVDPACGVSSVSSAKVSPKKLAAGGALASAIQGLAAGQCTAPGFEVPVKWKPGTPGPIKAGKAKVRVNVSADGKKDPDVLTLTCEPARPSFSGDVQPIFTERCAIAACHSGPSPQVPDLDAGEAHGATVGKPTIGNQKLPYVEAGSAKRSFLAWKILGYKNVPRMPDQCPNQRPCLDDAETYRILAWIQAGAAND